jgi:hypothetical protein
VEMIPGLDDLTISKPKRKRRTKAEIEGQQSPTGGTASAKVKRELEEIRIALGALFTIIGAALQFYNQVDGLIFVEKSPAVIDALIGIARTNDKVREVLLNFATVSGYGALASALIMMIIPIAANHNMLPKVVLFTAGLSDDTIALALQPKANTTNGNANSAMGNL